MSVFLAILGWLMVIGGSVALLAIRLWIRPDPSRSETEKQLYYGFAPYLFGAALLVALLGVALLRANGVDIGWPADN